MRWVLCHTKGDIGYWCCCTSPEHSSTQRLAVAKQWLEFMQHVTIQTTLSRQQIEGTGRVTIWGGFQVTEGLCGVSKYREHCSNTDRTHLCSPRSHPSYLWSLSPCHVWPRAQSFTAALLAERSIFWYCNHLTEALTQKIWGTQLPGTKIQAAQKHAMACAASLCSALLFSWHKVLQGSNLVAGLFIYLFFYCRHVLSPS